LAGAGGRPTRTTFLAASSRSRELLVCFSCHPSREIASQLAPDNPKLLHLRAVLDAEVAQVQEKKVDS